MKWNKAKAQGEIGQYIYWPSTNTTTVWSERRLFYETMKFSEMEQAYADAVTAADNDETL